MIQINRRSAPCWRLVALVPVMMAAILSIIGTGGSGSGSGDDFINCGPDEVSNRNFSEQEPFSFDLNVANHDRLLMNGKRGNITVTGVPGATSVMVTGVKRVLSDSVQDAQAKLQELAVSFRDLNNDVLLDTSQPQCPRGREYIVDYTISLPGFFVVRINNISGDVDLNTLDDLVSVNNISGTVTLTDIAGSAAVDLLTGDIVARITSLPLNGSIEMKILSGDISLEIPTGTSAEFSATVFSGSINLTNLTLKNPVSTPTSVSGTLGSGDADILLETEVIGDINVLGFP